MKNKNKTDGDVPIYKAVLILLIFSIIVHLIWRIFGWTFKTKYPWFYILALLCMLGFTALATLVFYKMEEFIDKNVEKIFQSKCNEKFRKWIVKFFLILFGVTLYVLLKY